MNESIVKKIRLMKRKLTSLLLLLFIACSKHNTSPVDQTYALLENRWTLASESFVYPPNTSLDSVYSGISFNFFQFTSGGTIIASLGNPAISSYTTNYHLQDDSTVLIYSENAAQYVIYHIEKLIEDSLILNTAGVRVVNNTTYSGSDQIVFYK
jgi:hypothetical protein